MYRIGIDLGGTNIVAGLVNDKLTIVDRTEVKTDTPRSARSIAADLSSMVKLLMDRNHLKREDIASVGVGVPCTANPETGWMEDADHLGFPEAPLVQMLSRQLGLPVRIGNDANVAAWGEYKTGGYQTDSFIMVTLGTGVGGGIILGGALWDGINHAAGEFGHMTISYNGEPCSCGKRGCFELYGSATALVRRATQKMRFDNRTALWELCGYDISKLEAKTVFHASGNGDPTARQLVEEYSDFLAEGLANIINIFQPEYLCIGGGVSRAGEQLLSLLRTKTASRVLTGSSKRNTKIVLAKLDNDAGVIGAALL